MVSTPHRWQPGESGNPKGRPINEYSPTRRLRELLLEETPNGTHADQVIQSLIEIAKRGDVPAIRTIFDRLDGRATETVNVNSNLQYTHTERRELSLIHMLEHTRPDVLRELVDKQAKLLDSNPEAQADLALIVGDAPLSAPAADMPAADASESKHDKGSQE